ncbi:MAG: hypothetical protein JW757_02775 [Anaerolineales bacterium]|nr:hypothetical protein [Anaerolineales bacterium]
MKKLAKKISTPDLLLIIFIMMNFILGFFIYPDYGISTDENVETRRSSLAFSMYTGTIDTVPAEAYRELIYTKYYGTAISTAARLAERLFGGDDYNPLLQEIPHFTYFVIFLAGVVAFYSLAQHFFGQWVALGSTLLFSTQPLLFGHGWINPKDTPHMSVFIIVVAAGFRVVDHWFLKPDQAILEPSAQKKPVRYHQIFITTLTILTLLLWGSAGLYPLADQLVDDAYQAAGDSLAGKLFQSLTTGGSLEGYQLIASLKIVEFQRWTAFLTPFLLVVGFLAAQRKNRLGGWQADLALLAAAAAWGIAISTRVLTLAAGGIVGLYALLQWKQKAIRPLVIYSLTASIFSFISWPFLWISGPKGLIESLITFSDYSHWRKLILFEGQLVFPEELPRRYIPKLMALQFTEPVVVLALTGFLISLILLWRRKTDLVKLGLLVAWFILPMLYLLIARPITYNNFRQYLFIIPPLFILTGYSLEALTNWIKKPVLNAFLILALLAPGLISIYRLHPYQYIYYNQFTGGVEGAFRKYELDYWHTALKETTEYLDENLPPDSKILIWGNDSRAKYYAEKIYRIDSIDLIPQAEIADYDYVILPSRYFLDKTLFPDAPILYTVERDNAILMLIKEIKNSNP